eukprot:3949362-Amphidinium_carterae.1
MPTTPCFGGFCPAVYPALQHHFTPSTHFCTCWRHLAALSILAACCMSLDVIVKSGLLVHLWPGLSAISLA